MPTNESLWIGIPRSSYNTHQVHLELEVEACEERGEGGGKEEATQKARGKEEKRRK